MRVFRLSGFNEAEAIKPRNRKSQICRRQDRYQQGFNEAEAIKPRNPGLDTRGAALPIPLQ